MARAPAPSSAVHPDASGIPVTRLSRPAQALYRPGMKRREFVNCLVEADLLDDATVFLGGLVACHAVWWACLCVWKLIGARMSPAQQDGFRVAVRWATEPSEQHRKECEALILKADYGD